MRASANLVSSTTLPGPAPPATITLKINWVIAVLVVGILVAASIAGLGYWVLSGSAKGNPSHAQLLNISGRQRMLTQRTTLEALEMVLLAGQPAAYARKRDALAQSVAELEIDHQWLMVSPLMGFHVSIQDAEREVNRLLREHIREARELVGRPREQLSLDDPSLLALRATREKTVSAIERVVNQEERDARGAYQNARRTVLLALPLTLMLSLLATIAVRLSRNKMSILAEESRQRGLLNQAILDNMTEGIIVADASASFLVFNRAAREILGLGARSEKVECWPESYRILRDDGETPLPAEELPLVRALKGETIHRAELCFRHPESTEARFLEVDAIPLSFRAGEEPGAFVAFADVTERRRLALERERSEQAARREETRRAEALEVEVLVRRGAERTLRAKGEELTRSNADLAQFAYIASHDLKEPLRTVGSFAGLLRRRYTGRFDAKGDQYIDFIVQGAQRMQALLDALLEYARIGANQEPLAPTGTGDAIADAVANLRATIEETGAQVTLPASSPVVAGNAIQLTQLFQNLIGNALKFQRPGLQPEVAVTVEPAGDSFHFAVRDNGIGIDPRFHERIFKLFQRLHDRETFHGTGIGLAICKKIVERHAGKIWIESAPDAGTTVHVSLSGPQPAARSWTRPDLLQRNDESIRAATWG